MAPLNKFCKCLSLSLVCVHQVLCDRIRVFRRCRGASHSCHCSAGSGRLADAHCSRSGFPGLELRRGLPDGGLPGEPEQQPTHSVPEDNPFHFFNAVLFVRALESLLLVLPQDSDVSLPSCSTAQVESSCSAVCSQSSWTVSLAVSDSGRSSPAALQLQKGEGVLTLFHSPPAIEESRAGGQPDPDQRPQHGEHMARLEAGDAPFNVSAWPLGSSQPLWGRYTSSCCSSQAEVLVWNTAGNMKRCHLTSGQQRQQREQIAETSGGGRPDFLFFWTLFLLWSPFL